MEGKVYRIGWKKTGGALDELESVVTLDIF
jgi:hypothetical protein